MKNLLLKLGKILFAAVVLMLWCVGDGVGQALTEDFIYTSGTLLTANGYTNINGTSNYITVTSSSLTYTNSPSSGVGNAVSMTTSGEDVTKTFSPTISSGNAYASFFVNVTSAQATGDYFFSLYDNVFLTKVFIKSSSTGYLIGLGKAGSTVTYDATVRAFNTTFLIVIKYVFNTGSATDDVVSLFIEPALGGVEPSPTIAALGNGTTDAGTINRIALRQGTAANASNQIIDGIRVGTTWASVTPASACTDPTTQASNITFTNVASTTMTVNWTRGGTPGDGVIVVAKQGGAVDSDPVDNTSYTAGAAFGTGTQIGTGNYVMFIGNAATCNITGLSAITTYHFKVYEKNCTGTSIKIYTTSPPSNSQATTSACATVPTIATTEAANTITTTTAASGGQTIDATTGCTITGKGVCWSTSTSPTIANSSTSNGTTTADFTSSLTGLSAQTLYYVRAYATNSFGTGYANQITFRTLSAELLTHPANFTASPRSASQIELGFSAASTISNAYGFIILQRQGANPTGTPTDATSYSVGNTIGDGTVAAIITSTATTTSLISGLSTTTQYNFSIIPFSFDGANAATYNYYTAATIKTSFATTYCNAVAMPLIEGFNATTIPSCWTQTTITTGSPAPSLTFVSNESNPTVLPSECSHFANFNSFTAETGTDIRLVSPPINTSGKSNLKVGFDWYECDLQSTKVDEGVTVQYSLNGGGVWTPVTFYQRYKIAPDGWSTKICNMPAAIDNQSSILIGLLFHSQFGADCNLDNFSLTTCVAPSTVTCSSVTFSTATISWTASVSAPSNGYQYEVRTSGCAGSGATGLVLSGTTIAGDVNDNLTGLTPNTTYYVYVRSDCGSSDYSAWTSTYSFTTQKTEPTNYPSAFACGTTTGSTIPLTWTAAATGSQAPDFYLIKWSAVGYTSISDPVDGVAEVDAIGVQNISYGTNTYTFGSLSQSTTYYFKIWSYTKSGTYCNYKTGSEPQTNCTTTASCATDLIISEYVEGSSNNKYIEIYNFTGASVNLANYKLEYYANGASTATQSHTLSGTLNDGSTIVFKNSATTLYTGTTTVSNAVAFNGNDAVALIKLSPAGYVDIIGRIGENPGSAWTSTSNSTLDKTLVRKSTVIAGITSNPSSGFPTLESEWTQYNQDDVSHLGSHTMTCAASCTPPTNQSTSLIFSSIATTSVTASWTRPSSGAGDAILISAKAASALSEPTNGTAYAADATFGSGDACGGGRAVYNGTGSSVSVSNLSPETRYYFNGNEFMNATNCYKTPALSNNFYTLSLEPSAHPASFSATAVSYAQIDLSFSAASTLTNADGYIILRRADTYPDATGVTDGVAPASLSLPVGTTLVTTINSTLTETYSNTGLSQSQAYYYCLIAYNADATPNGGTYNYYTAATIQTATATTWAGPSITITGSIADFGTVCLTNLSTQNSYTVAGANLTSNLVITAPTHFEVSFVSGTSFAGTLALTPSGGIVSTTTVYVRFKPTTSGVKSDNITHTSTNATTQNVAVSGTGASNPTLSTTAISSIAATTATSGGDVTSINNSDLTAKGVCWNTSANPTTGNNKTNDIAQGTTAGTFTSSLTSLAANTTYYVRAYAINVCGSTVYGNEVSFTTMKYEPSNMPSNLTCNAPTHSTILLTWTNATDGVLPDGYLIKWATVAGLSDPSDGTIESLGGYAYITDGSGTYTATDLTPLTTYYFEIWSYTNSGAGIDYKTDAAPVIANMATLQGPVTVYSGSFETDDETWTFYDGNADADDGNWSRTTNAGGTEWDPGDAGSDGTWYMYIPGYNVFTNDWLISKEFVLTNYLDCKMDIRSWYSNSGGDNIVVKVSENYISGNPTDVTWSTIVPTTTFPGTAATWTTQTLDLSDYDGKTIKVAFYYTGDKADDKNWAIDQYSVTGLDVSSADASTAASEPETQVATANISSLYDTEGEAVDVLKFDIDDFGPDGKPTKVTKIVVKNNSPANAADWTTNIQGVKLYNSATSSYVTTSTVDITDTEITINIVSGNLVVSDASSVTLTISMYLHASNIEDGKTLQFMIDYDAHGFKQDNYYSRFATTFGTANITSNIFTIDVSATKLLFTSNKPASSGFSATNIPVEVFAGDANGNRDISANHTITLAKATGFGSISSASSFTQNLSNGVFLWSDVIFSVSDIYTISASTTGLTSIASGSIYIYEVIKYQGFEVDPATPPDNWSYTGSLTEVSGSFYTGSKSGLISSTGAEIIYFDNVSISSYSDVKLSLAYAASNVSSGDDLYLEIEYNNGASWDGTGSLKLVDGHGTTPAVLFGNTSSTNTITVASNPWITEIPATETQVRIRFRTAGGTYNYYTDDVKLYGIVKYPPNIAISTPAISSANVFQNTDNHILYKAAISVSDYQAIWQGISFTTAGTYASTDLKSGTPFKLWYNTTDNFATASQKGTAQASAGTGETVSFSSLNTIAAAGSTFYLWFTADINCDAIAGKTISVNALQHSNLSFFQVNYTTSSPYTAAGTQSVIDRISIPSVSNAVAQSGQNETMPLSWTNNTCYDEILIIGKQTSSVTATPSGDGSAYSANPAFGSGTQISTGEYVVYKSNTSSVTVTALTNNTKYYFKIFVRKGSMWSSGVEVWGTPDNRMPAMITEWSQGHPSNNAEWIEILVLQDNLDMRNWEIRDENSTFYGTSGSDGFLIQFKNIDFWKTIAKGTILLLYNPGPISWEGEPVSDNTNGDCNYMVMMSRGEITTYFNTFVSDLTHPTANSWSSSNAISNDTPSDNPRLFDGSGSLVHDWDNGNTMSGRPNSNEAVYYTGSDETGIYTAANWTKVPATFGTIPSVTINTALTPGVMNNTDQIIWVDAMRNYAVCQYRTKQDGNWSTKSTWESTIDGSTWKDCVKAPIGSVGSILVRSSHDVTVVVTAPELPISADELTVENNGQIIVNANNTFTINNGTGNDLTLYGILNVQGTLVSGPYLTVNSFIDFKSTAKLVTNNVLGVNGALSNFDGFYAFDAGNTVSFGFNGTSAQVTGTWMPANCKDLIIDNAAGITLSQSTTLSGDLTLNSGYLVLGDKTLTANGTCSGSGTLNGSTASTLIIGGTSGGTFGTLNFTPSYQNLGTFTINRSGTLPVIYLGSNLTVNNNLSITSGSFNVNAAKWLTVNGNLTTNYDATGLILRSNNTGTASLIVQGTLSGDATAQRYITGDTWHMVSSPFSTASGSAYASTYYYYYDESTSDWWSGATTHGTSGWMSTSGTSGAAIGYLLQNASTTTYNLTGALHNATPTSIPLSFTNSSYDDIYDGWNFIGNPYPCALDWNSADITKPGTMNNAIYIYDDAIDNYKYYVNGGGTNSCTNIIPAMQGFFVKSSSGGGNLTLGRGARTHSATAFTKRAKDSIPDTYIRLQTQMNNYNDESLIRFNAEATASFDGQYDAYKRYSWNSDVPQIYSITEEGIELAINTLPYFSSQLTVPLGFTVGSSGNCTFTASEIQSLSTEPIYFEDMAADNGNGMIINLLENSTYTFYAPAGVCEGRFFLHFSPTITQIQHQNVVDNKAITIYSNQISLFVKVDKLSVTNSTVSIYNMTGKKVEQFKLKSSGLNRFTLHQPAGTYLVSVIIDNKVVTKKVFID